MEEDKIMELFELKKAILVSGLKQTYISRVMGINHVLFSKKLNGYLPFLPEEKTQLLKIIKNEHR
jgi:hypothetical protein